MPEKHFLKYQNKIKYYIVRNLKQKQQKKPHPTVFQSEAGIRISPSSATVANERLNKEKVTFGVSAGT